MRSVFEEFITLPPFERSIERLPTSSNWPGQYRDEVVEVAWEAWQAATVEAARVCKAYCKEIPSQLFDRGIEND